MATMIELIKQLREATGAGVLDCRQALEQHGSNYAEALRFLQEQAEAQAARRADRMASQGLIDLYSHGGGRIGVMVEVNCETDFTARSAAFKAFAHELALQIAAANPLWVRDEDIPAEVASQEVEKAAASARAAGKPEALVGRIAQGHLKKFMDQRVLLRQPSIRDDSVSVAQLLARAAASSGENVIIRRFVRWEMETE